VQTSYRAKRTAQRCVRRSPSSGVALRAALRSTGAAREVMTFDHDGETRHNPRAHKYIRATVDSAHHARASAGHAAHRSRTLVRSRGRNAQVAQCCTTCTARARRPERVVQRSASYHPRGCSARVGHRSSASDNQMPPTKPASAYSLKSALMPKATDFPLCWPSRHFHALAVPARPSRVSPADKRRIGSENCWVLKKNASALEAHCLVPARQHRFRNS
jgi:hypothetical protein